MGGVNKNRSIFIAFFAIALSIFCSLKVSAVEITSYPRISPHDLTQRQIAVTADILSLGHVQSAAGLNQDFDLNSQVGVGFEYSQPLPDDLKHFRATTGIGYSVCKSVSNSTMTLLPVEVFGEYSFSRLFRRWTPFAGFGAMAIYSSTAVSQNSQSYNWHMLPALTAGFEWQTPWNWMLHGRFRQTQNLQANSTTWTGQIYDIGAAVAL